MDEFQGRVSTSSALYKKEVMSNSKVAHPLPIPIMLAAPIMSDRPGDKDLLKNKVLKNTVQTSFKKNCNYVPENGFIDVAFSISRLSENKVLISTLCWTAANNQGNAYWVVDDKTPYGTELITTDANDDANGQISFAEKSRGHGDCWSTRT